MYKSTMDQERQENKINLILKVNYISAAFTVILAIICYLLLGIKEVIPHTLLAFGILNSINSFSFKKHKSVTTTHIISSILALIGALIVTLYSGGIHSPFIFLLALIVFAGYVYSRKNTQIYLNIVFFLILLIFSQSITEYSFTRNVVPEASRNVFSLLGVLFSLYILGNVFGKNLIKTHNNLYTSKQDLNKKLIEKETLLKVSQYLIKSIKGIENKIKLTINITDIKLGIDTAIPLGLLINEAVTNALKYGIVDDNEGEIHIAITKEVGKEYVLKIGDNGVGFPESVNYKTTKSLGLKLIYNLTRQLKGTIQRDVSKKGTNYVIKFQEIEQKLHPVV